MTTEAAAKEDLSKAAVRRALWRILIYYVLFIGLLLVLASQFTWFEDLFTGKRLRELEEMSRGLLGGEVTSTFGGSPTTGSGIFGWQSSAVAAVTVVSALGVMVPVAWTYILIKARGGYHQSVVHALLILPMAVTGIVLIVQNSVALAFSLAGIVAAVRFRTTLEDTKDAVYIFLAIGVGLAAGTLAIGIALALSILFNAANLVLWHLNFGNIYVDQLGRTAAMGLGDVLAGPESATTALQIGDMSLLTALKPSDVREVAHHRARLEQYLDSVTETTKERKSYSVLLVHTSEVGDVQTAVEGVLKRAAVRWRLAEILPSGDGVSVLEYLVRVREGIPQGAVLDAVRREGGDKVRAAELRSLEGLKRRDRP